ACKHTHSDSLHISLDAVSSQKHPHSDTHPPRLVSPTNTEHHVTTATHSHAHTYTLSLTHTHTHTHTHTLTHTVYECDCSSPAAVVTWLVSISGSIRARSEATRFALVETESSVTLGFHGVSWGPGAEG